MTEWFKIKSHEKVDIIDLKHNIAYCPLGAELEFVDIEANEAFLCSDDKDAEKY